MIEGVIGLLITICVIALVVYLIFWVIEVVGIPIPAKVQQIIWIIVALIVILLVVRALPGLGLHMRL
jgi:hypothetical protein